MLSHTHRHTIAFGNTTREYRMCPCELNFRFVYCLASSIWRVDWKIVCVFGFGLDLVSFIEYWNNSVHVIYYELHMRSHKDVDFLKTAYMLRFGLAFLTLWHQRQKPFKKQTICARKNNILTATATATKSHSSTSDFRNAPKCWLIPSEWMSERTIDSVWLRIMKSQSAR